ncbi:MAG: glutamate--tRNA ligase family protein, partial [Rhodoferax sp.]
GSLYQQALDRLVTRDLAYPCSCTRRELEAAWRRDGRSRSRHAELVYPGTCRENRSDAAGASASGERAWRLRTDAAGLISWTDRRLGHQLQHVQAEVGDFVLRRADGCFSYQLAVVVDDAAQRVTDVVRGEDLASNTARQNLLQQHLGLPRPRYLHTPLVLGADREKLSKQNGAQPIDSARALTALNEAAGVLGLAAQTGALADALYSWVSAWRQVWPPLYNPVP